MSNIANATTYLKDAIPLDQLKRVLVVKLRHHGDVLLTSPVFSVLKNHAPHCEIDALVYADTAEMLTEHPAISELHTIDRNWKKLGLWGQASAELGLLRQLKHRQYDLIIHLTEHWRGAWLVRLLKPRWAVSYKQSGRGKRWSKRFTHLIENPKNALRHVVEAHLDALRRIGIPPSPEERRLTLVAGASADVSVEHHLQALGLAGKPFIHIHPASRWFFKCWPATQMAELITAIQAKGWPVVLTAAPSPDELAMVEAIQSQLAQPALSLAGKLSLKELAALTQKARLFVGVDSAPMHIAAAMATPVVALFGPSGDKQWGAWSSGAPVRLITSQLHPCRPCGVDGCGGGKVSDCLTHIPVSTVLTAVEELLAS
jgi:heptosyltransferase-3